MGDFSFYTYALGCKVNSYEDNAISTELLSKGLKKVDKSSEADLIILNSCSVTGMADKKSRQRLSRLRREAPNACLLIMGCYSQKHAEEALSLGADIVLGTSNREMVFELFQRFLEDKQKISLVKESVRREGYSELGLACYSETRRAYLKVQDGCDNFCSYCLIPIVRGNSRSRRPGRVIEEANSLVSKGYKEIVITGISTGSYGRDLGDGKYRLSNLLRDILEQTPGLKRLRVSSIEESEIDDDFLQLLREFPQLVDHLHIPTQSGSSSVLKAMHRRYDTGAFMKKIDKIREIRPEIAITTDVIAGFPGESEEEHKESLAFFEKVGFAEIHVFPYSRRPLTQAYKMKDLPADIKKRRVHEILDLSKKLRGEYESRFFGRKLEVYVEEYDSESKIAKGHSGNYLLISFHSEVDPRGEFVDVEYNPQTASD